MRGPLDGIRVFDFTLLMVGPWSTMNLGALGADVIHIERPGIADADARANANRSEVTSVSAIAIVILPYSRRTLDPGRLFSRPGSTAGMSSGVGGIRCTRA